MSKKRYGHSKLSIFSSATTFYLQEAGCEGEMEVDNFYLKKASFCKWWNSCSLKWRLERCDVQAWRLNPNPLAESIRYFSTPISFATSQFGYLQDPKLHWSNGAQKQQRGVTSLAPWGGLKICCLRSAVDKASKCPTRNSASFQPPWRWQY